MYYRCRKCLKFKELNKVHFVSCPCCDFRTARCNEANCGGKQGALRSLVAHVRWWASRGSGISFNIHNKVADTVARPLRALAGGKKG